MKILIIRFSSIGDIVLTSPVIRCLKQQLPNAEIHFATKSKFKNLIQHNPYIDKIHLLNDSIFELLAELKKEKFDLIIDLHHNLRTSIIKAFLPAKSYSFDKLNFEKWLMVNFKINLLPDIHIVDRYMNTVKKLGVKNDGNGLDFFITDEEDKFGFNYYNQNQSYTAFAIGGQFATKRLPKEKIVELINRQTEKVVLLGGKEDEFTANYILSNTKNTESFCGKISFNQSASIVKYANKILTHDTGLMHVAAAYQKKIDIYWGNTTPQFGMYPYLKNQANFKNFEVQNLRCRPCSKIGYAKCPKQHFNCMSLQLLK
ncbi:MAG: glycosyltransferase, family 9 [Bacteroidota bacterium]